MCNVSTRKYARVVNRGADALGLSKSAVSRAFVKESAQALAKLMGRSFAEIDLVAIYVDGIIVASHHNIATLGVDAQGNKHVLGLASGSSGNAKVVKDLLATLADRGVDLNVARLWVIDGSKALRSAIEQRCGSDAKVQRWRIHKIRNVTERPPKDKAQHPDAAASVREGWDQMFTITDLGVTGELARCLATTNVIESPNSVVRRVSRRVTNHKSTDMALRWTAAGFLEAEKSFKKLRGFAQLKSLINSLRSRVQPLKKAA